jgi:hypothetical protein
VPSFRAGKLRFCGLIIATVPGKLYAMPVGHDRSSFVHKHYRDYATLGVVTVMLPQAAYLNF